MIKLDMCWGKNYKLYGDTFHLMFLIKRILVVIVNLIKLGISLGESETETGVSSIVLFLEG